MHITLMRRKPHTAAAAALLYHRQKGRTAHRRGPSQRPQTLTCNHTAIRSPGLPFDGLLLRNTCICTDYYLFADPGGWKAELA